ncbi:MAG TPA: DUF202 domain-containing protein [Chitinophagales bacterium]|mgnify:CR=1 FL=1|nr:DUF202 domain-containing protein [Chitinophagales bacterium]HMU69687.1 DUF202 domain-containing protein [Chitinophagales bacterium]HMX03560.1 DUF202 domain-containing protein [Chitinophagales bacterium]HMZ88197.1 DUF202 domain-containing protein [Chitinophagales bacterium]HNA57189.1 DUF202 domain-containing protein [Chitinophagales bacterium]
MSKPFATNPELVLREELAIQRTTLANQSTFLSFIRTGLYFLLGGLSLTNLLKMNDAALMEVIMFSIAALLVIIGSFNYMHHQRKIARSKLQIGQVAQATRS